MYSSKDPNIEWYHCDLLNRVRPRWQEQGKIEKCSAWFVSRTGFLVPESYLIRMKNDRMNRPATFSSFTRSLAFGSPGTPNFDRAIFARAIHPTIVFLESNRRHIGLMSFENLKRVRPRAARVKKANIRIAYTMQDIVSRIPYKEQKIWQSSQHYQQQPQIACLL